MSIQLWCQMNEGENSRTHDLLQPCVTNSVTVELEFLIPLWNGCMLSVLRRTGLAVVLPPGRAAQHKTDLWIVATQAELASLIRHHQQLLFTGKRAVARVATNTVIEEPDAPVKH